MKNATFLFLFILPIELFCCTFTPDSFCSTIIANIEKIIVYGTIISKDEDGLDLEVIELLDGEESKSQIRIWDGKDFDCNGPFDMSTNLIGDIYDTIIISLPRITQVENPWDVIGDYTRPTPYGKTPKLFVEGGIAKGFISGTPYSADFNNQTVEYEKLRETILNHGNCTDLLIISSTNRSDIKNNITVQNPISSTLSINQSLSNEIIEVNIYSLAGQKLITQRTEDQLQIVISVENLQSGLYILQMIKSDLTQETVKVVKQQSGV